MAACASGPRCIPIARQHQYPSRRLRIDQGCWHGGEPRRRAPLLRDGVLRALAGRPSRQGKGRARHPRRRLGRGNWSHAAGRATVVGVLSG
jgi:hypothetical protein